MLTLTIGNDGFTHHPLAVSSFMLPEGDEFQKYVKLPVAGRQ